jgi:hypothetical protein
MPRGDHGPSIKNPATYEALKREGKSKSSAAAISNAALNKGYKKGAHHNLVRTMAANAYKSRKR